MSLRLETSIGTPLARATLALTLTVALTAAMLALFPAAAGAQTRDESVTSVVVRPGDSLWSISEGRLGPNASPRRVMNGAERIHALNRVRIGADPHLVLVGQELSIPRAMSGSPNGATVPARKAAEASGPEAPGSDPRKRAAKGPAGKEALPDQRAVAPVPAARMVASNDAQPSSVVPLLRTVLAEFASATAALTDSLFGIPADARAEGRLRLLGLGVLALALTVAALAAARARGAARRRKARRREAWFRETYGRPYAASDPSASQEDASSRAPEVRGQTPTPDGPTNAGAASEGRSDHTDHSAVARAKRARVLRKRPPGLRGQPPRLRARGTRQPVRARALALGRPLDALPWGRARHEEWEPGAALVGALKGLPLRPGAGRGENLAGLEPHLEEALGALERLERLRGLFEREKTRREALRALMAAVERGE